MSSYIKKEIRLTALICFEDDLNDNELIDVINVAIEGLPGFAAIKVLEVKNAE
jgi:hypothetical protein